MRELAGRFSFRKVSDRRLVFTRFVLDEVRRLRSEGLGSIRCLDIGSGRGMARDPRYVAAIGAEVDHLVGVEPDDTLERSDTPFEELHPTLLQDAPLEPGSIHVAYAFMVMEHVAEPRAFLEAVHRVLHPQGVFLFLTPNGRHYFVRIAAGLHRLGLDEMVLHRVRRRQVGAYHYPVHYRFNHPDRIRRLAGEVGFGDVSLAFFEGWEAHHYFPGVFRPLYTGLSALQRTRQKPEVLLNLVGRLVP